MIINKIILPRTTLLNAYFFHTTQHNSAIGGMMKKIMNGSKKKRRIYSDDPILPPSNTFVKDLFKKVNPENKRRTSVLNKLFMTRITDLMATGESAAQLAGYGLEINRVKIAPDYRSIKVLWIAKQSVNDDEIANLLQNISGQLRHELTQLHVIGTVPKINFVKDKEYAKIMEVESRLAVADFGEDYEPSEPGSKYRSYLMLTKSLDQKLKEKIFALEEQPKIEDNEEIPQMPQNVLGLNHADILARIKGAIQKSQATHRCQVDNKQKIVEDSVNLEPVEFKNAKARREAFTQFLVERQLLRNRMRKMNKNYRPDWDYLEEESEIAKQQQINLIKLKNWDDADYIEEDYDVSDTNSENIR